MMQKNLSVTLMFAILNLTCSSKSGKRNFDTTKNGSYHQAGLLYVKVVVDGDTFWADNGTTNGLKIRLIGVDAPETRRTQRKEVGYFGKEAKAYLTALLNNKSVRLEFDLKRTDQFGRTLAYVFLEDGTFINAELVKNGYAITMTVPPNVKYAAQFVSLEKVAKNNRRGLWK